MKEILFRCSGLGQLMTNAQGKSPKEKYEDAVAWLAKAEPAYEATKNKETDTAKKAKVKIEAAKKELPILEVGKDKVVLGATCTSFIAQTVRGIQWNRQESFGSKYTDKGNKAEGDSMTLYTMQKGLGMIYQNTQRLSDDFITGLMDPMLKDGTILPFDLKSSWDWTTFPYKGAALDPKYDWQNQGYLRLLRATFPAYKDLDTFTTAYCLVNTPPDLIEKERTSLWYKLGCPDRNGDFWHEQAVIHERNSIYDIEAFRQYLDLVHYPYEWVCSPEEWDGDIPPNQRVVEFTTEYDAEKQEMIEERVKEARQFIQQNF